MTSPATTHHAALSALPTNIRARGAQLVRYVQSDPLILTAGGLSSGIDSALARGRALLRAKVAQAAADDMEYQGQGWKTNAGSGQPTQVQATIPLAYRDRETLWQGMFHPAYPKPEPELPLVYILPRLRGSTGQPSMCRASRRFGLPLDDVRVDRVASLQLVTDGGPLDFRGTMTADRISGNLTHGGSVTPLTLSKANSPPAALQ